MDFARINFGTNGTNEPLPVEHFFSSLFGRFAVCSQFCNVNAKDICYLTAEEVCNITTWEVFYCDFVAYPLMKFVI